MSHSLDVMLDIILTYLDKYGKKKTLIHSLCTEKELSGSLFPSSLDNLCTVYGDCMLEVFLPFHVKLAFFFNLEALIYWCLLSLTCVIIYVYFLCYIFLFKKPFQQGLWNLSTKGYLFRCYLWFSPFFLIKICCY